MLLLVGLRSDGGGDSVRNPEVYLVLRHISIVVHFDRSYIEGCAISPCGCHTKD